MELLLTMGLLGAFFVAFYRPILLGLQVATATHQRSRVIHELTHTIDLLTRELSIADNLDAAEDQRLQFDADVDGNGTLEQNILYQLSGAELRRTDANGRTVTLVHDVTAWDFDYMDLAGTILPTPVAGLLLPNIRVVRMTMTAGPNSEVLSLASAAFLRNN